MQPTRARGRSARAALRRLGFASHVHPARDDRLERELGVIADDDRERRLLHHVEPLRGREPVREQPIAQHRVDRRIEADELDVFAGRDVGEASIDHASARRTQFAAPPTANAVGMISASISAAVRKPCSFTMIITLAMQGTNSVIVTMPTTICTGVSALPIANSPVAPKSRRRKPMTNAAEASFGKPSHAVTSGSPRAMIQGSAPILSSANIRNVPNRKSGITSTRYQRSPPTVFFSTFAATGSRIGGISVTSGMRRPGMSFAASQPAPSIVMTSVAT